MRSKIFPCFPFLIGLFCLISSQILEAQQTVNGIVLDEMTKEPIVGATVEIENTTFRVQTKDDGTFRIFVPESGTGFKVIFGKRKQVFSLTSKEEVTLLLPLKTTKSKTSLIVGKTVKGRVIDAETGVPLSNAEVEIVNTTFRTNTDENGEFKIYIPKGGTQFKITFENRKGKFQIGENEEQLFALGNKFSEKSSNQLFERRTLNGQIDSWVLLGENDFKQGNLYNPIQLIQGVSSGSLITRPGSNPNGAFDIRIRGINSFSQRANPLIVIDGLPESNLESIDPMDIASFQILKDAASATKYGIRGNSGVIEITTKSAQGTAFRINYHGYLASENYSKRVPVLSSREFVDLGGNDFGDGTDWLEEITQNSASAASHLSFSGGHKLKYYASLSYRNVNGILGKSGFETYGARINLNYKTLNDRLEIGALLGANIRDVQYSFPQAFRYATTFNPTAPIFGNDVISMQNGGYFTVNQFDHFNPVAMIEQNTNEGEMKNYSGTIRGSFEILKGLKIRTLYARQHNEDFVGQYYPSNSALFGFFSGGEARINDAQKENFNWESALNYERTFGDLRASFTGGYGFQQVDYQSNFTTAKDFSSDDEGYKNLDLAFDIEQEDFKSKHDLSAFFGSFSLSVKDIVHLYASVRREGSSWLGSNKKWGVFQSYGVGVDVSKFLNIQTLDHFNLRASYGRTGNAPVQGFLSKQLFRSGVTIFQNGEFVQNGFFNSTNANPNLDYEKKNEFNFGIDFGFLNNKVQGSIDFYSSKTDDLIQDNVVDSPPNFARHTWLNSGAASTKGTDFNLYFDIVQKQEFGWRGSLQFSKFKTKVKKWAYPIQYIAMPGAPGSGNVFLVEIEEGESLGNFVGLIFEGIDPSGFPIFKESEGSFVPDFGRLGNGLPKNYLGLRQQLTYKRFELDFFIRGAFGHQIANLPRFFYEVPNRIFSNINAVQTQYFDDNQIETGPFSDLQLEDGGYLKWDYLTVAYNFNMDNPKFIRDLKLYFTLQNPMIFTKYSGANPEVRLKDTGSSDNGNLNGEERLTAFSIDRRNTYLPSKGWIFGLKVGL